MAEKALPCPTVLRQRLRYEADTGKLFWRSLKLSDFTPTPGQSAETKYKVWQTRYAGKEAFTYVNDGYRVGKVCGCRLKAHRVIWAIVHGEWPRLQIDHINGQKDDNRLENLRDVSARANANNRTYLVPRTFGKIGVYRHMRGWRAEVSVAGKVIKLGYYKTKEEAIAARNAAEILISNQPHRREVVILEE